MKVPEMEKEGKSTHFQNTPLRFLKISQNTKSLGFKSVIAQHLHILCVLIILTWKQAIMMETEFVNLTCLKSFNKEFQVL